MRNIYIFAKLSKLDCLGVRLGGAGLGNILFPWARAVVAAKKNNIPRINTTWKSLKLGPLLRGEMDTRGYSDLFCESNIQGLKKFFLLIFAKRITEAQFAMEIRKKTFWPRVVIFTGMQNQMNDIIDDYILVKNELLNMVQKKHLYKIEAFSGKGISLHIRMGDFYVPDSEDEIREGATNCRLPLKWYTSIVEKIREKVGYDINVNVFSDGTDEELEEILKMNNVRRHYYGSAIADMLALSKSDILVASNSTFSLWSSYLGRMPTIWFPGTQRIQLFNKNEIEIELDYDSPITRELEDYLVKI